MIYVKNVVILQQLGQSEPKKGSHWSSFMTGPVSYTLPVFIG